MTITERDLQLLQNTAVHLAAYTTLFSLPSLHSRRAAPAQRGTQCLAHSLAGGAHAISSTQLGRACTTPSPQNAHAANIYCWEPAHQCSVWQESQGGSSTSSYSALRLTQCYQCHNSHRSDIQKASSFNSTHLFKEMTSEPQELTKQKRQILTFSVIFFSNVSSNTACSFLFISKESSNVRPLSAGWDVYRDAIIPPRLLKCTLLKSDASEDSAPASSRKM